VGAVPVVRSLGLPVAAVFWWEEQLRTGGGFEEPEVVEVWRVRLQRWC